MWNWNLEIKFKAENLESEFNIKVIKQFAGDAFYWVSNLEEKSLLHLKPKSAGRKTAEIKSSSLNQKSRCSRSDKAF